MTGRRQVWVALALAGFLALPAQGRADGGGAMEGRVTSTAGLPLAGICVTAGTGYSFEFGHATTDEDGTYRIEGLNPGTYRVLFEDCNEEVRFLRQWYDGRSSFWDADPVEVTEESTVSGIDAALVEGGFITGTLTDENHDPASACVAATDEDWYVVTAASSTDAEGRYRIGPLPPGQAHIVFADCSLYPEYDSFPIPGGSVVVRPIRRGTSEHGFVPEWFDDAPSFWDSTAVPVVSGIDTPGIDAELAFAGGITGVVTDESGNPLEGICVEAYDGLRWRGSSTQDNGFYAIDSLAPGPHKVAFFGCASGDYRYEWFDDAPSDIVADPVTVSKLTWTNHIDAALAKRPKPDLAITGLKVESVPIVAQDMTIAKSPWLRRITVDVANLGTAATDDYSTLDVWVVSRSDRARDWLASESVRLAAGQRRQLVYEWDGSDTFGDVRVEARVCSFDDADRNNNSAGADSYSVVGGTGLGFRTRPFAYGFERFCGIIVIPVPGTRQP